MEVPFYFTVKEFKEKYFEDFNKYREYNDITLAKFLRLVGDNIFRAYEEGNLLELYIENHENIELDKECYIELYELLYISVIENGSEEEKQAIKNFLGNGSKKEIERVIDIRIGKYYDIFNDDDIEVIYEAIVYIQLSNMFKAISNIFIKEKYYEELIIRKTEDITEQDFSNNENKERIILLEKMGIIDFIKEKQSNPNNIKQTAEILSSFTGIKSTTLYSYLLPILSPHRDDKDKNSPYKNPENLQRANKTLHKLPIK